MKKLSIFLAGGSGFIGKNLLESIADKYTVIAPNRNQLNLLDFYAVSHYLKKHGPFDVVLNTAVIGGRRNSQNSPYFALQNLALFFNFVSNQKYFKKYIHFGSGAEFDKSKDIKHIKEEDFNKSMPSDPFGFSKHVIATYIEANKKFLNLRLFGVYGKHENYNIGFVSNTICRAILNKPIIINKNVFYDYIYASELASVVSYFIENRSKYRSYNVGSGKPIDLLGLTAIIKSLSKSESTVNILEDGLTPEYSCNVDRLKREMGYHPKSHGLSLKELYEWYKKRENQIDI